MPARIDRKAHRSTGASSKSEPARRERRSDRRASSDGFTISTDAKNRTVVDLGGGNDRARLEQLAGGRVRLVVNGDSVTLSAAQAGNLVVRGGSGDDRITLANGVRAGVTLDGGRGDDVLAGGRGRDRLVGGSGSDKLIGRGGDDVVDGGAGDDYLEGSRGNDLLAGRGGIDTLYGLGGDDAIDGGSGRDHVNGGAGNDTLDGAAGRDALIGGQGDDAIAGGGGRDVLAGGDGVDVLDGGAGSDRAYAQRDDVVRAEATTEVTLNPRLGQSIEIRGDRRFRERVQSDLDALRSLPIGQRMLRDLDRAGHRVIIRQTSEGNSARFLEPRDAYRRGEGSDVLIDYNPEGINHRDPEKQRRPAQQWQRRAPLFGLFHELVHARQAATGTTPRGESYNPGHVRPDRRVVGNHERAAVGLPYDHDGNPRTPRVRPTGPTENDLRAELGTPRRPTY